MLIEPMTSLPDLSRPGLTMITIGAVDLQVAGGNWTTREEGRKVCL